MRIKRVNEFSTNAYQILDKAEKYEPKFTEIKKKFNSILEDDHIDLVHINEIRTLVEKEIVETSSVHSIVKIELNKLHDEYKKNPTDDADGEKLVMDLEEVESKIYDMSEKLSEYLEALDELYEAVDKEYELIKVLKSFKF